MSPLGDLVHTFPAVDQVIPTALRRWRRDWRKALRSGQIAGLRARLQGRRYDLVIDAQGLL